MRSFTNIDFSYRGRTHIEQIQHERYDPTDCVATPKERVYRFTKFYNFFFVEDLLSTAKYTITKHGTSLISTLVPYEKYCEQYAVAHAQDLGCHALQTFCNLFCDGRKPLVID